MALAFVVLSVAVACSSAPIDTVTVRVLLSGYQRHRYVVREGNVRIKLVSEIGAVQLVFARAELRDFSLEAGVKPESEVVHLDAGSYRISSSLNSGIQAGQRAVLIVKER